mmetsp:Transcript_5435/g.15111  ORF Transcript_5435/g.15111 Transcript_5435/m.15111 type:complete len:216 (-) Transcript_5435:1964-2611(-)
MAILDCVLQWRAAKVVDHVGIGPLLLHEILDHLDVAACRRHMERPTTVIVTLVDVVLFVRVHEDLHPWDVARPGEVAELCYQVCLQGSHMGLDPRNGFLDICGFKLVLWLVLLQALGQVHAHHTVVLLVLIADALYAVDVYHQHLHKRLCLHGVILSKLAEDALITKGRTGPNHAQLLLVSTKEAENAREDVVKAEGALLWLQDGGIGLEKLHGC